MTLEKLLKMSASELEAMTDQEVETLFTPYFKVTRPELAVTETDKKKFATDKLIAQAKAKMRDQAKQKQDELAGIASAFGFDPAKLGIKVR